MRPLPERAVGDDMRGAAGGGKGDEGGGAHRPEFEARMLPRRRRRAHREYPSAIGGEHRMAVEGRNIADLPRRRCAVGRDRPERAATLLAPRQTGTATRRASVCEIA